MWLRDRKVKSGASRHALNHRSNAGIVGSKGHRKKHLAAERREASTARPRDRSASSHRASVWSQLSATGEGIPKSATSSFVVDSSVTGDEASDACLRAAHDLAFLVVCREGDDR